MPVLLGNHEFLSDKPLKMKLELLKIENPSAWEGWIEYKIELYNGEVLLIESGSDATILNGDIRQLCDFLTDQNTGYFEPLEPDFRITRELDHQIKNCSELIVILDEGIRRGQGYSRSGIGFRLIVSNEDLKSFASSIKGQYDALTSGL